MPIDSLASDAVIHSPVVELPDFARSNINLASEDFGAKVVSCSDEFFAAAQRCLQSSSPVFVPNKFDHHGKWMDGWETRRRRQGGHDFAIIQLAFPGVVKGLDIDTSHFTGNYPQAASIQAWRGTGTPDDNAQWTELVASTALAGNTHHFLEVDDDRVWTHLRLSIYPDGGIARFRVYGRAWCDWSTLDPAALYEVSALQRGGRIVAFNNAHFGTPFRLIMPGRGINMGDGWETRRRREPGYDWCVLELGHVAVLEKIEIDTAHFKGNYPDHVSVQAAHCEPMQDQSLITQAMFWPELLPKQKMAMDRQHFFDSHGINTLGPVTHVRINMFPDGGISRVRFWGRLHQPTVRTVT